MNLSVITEMLNVLAPIGLIVGIGFCLQKFTEIINTNSMSALVMLVGTPSLVFSTLTTTELPVNVLMQVSLGALCATALAIVFSIAILKLLDFDARTYLPALTMPNSGNLGLPLVLLAFGDDGLAIGVAFFFVIAIIQYAAMPVVVTGSFSLRRMIKEPIIWSVSAALLFKFTQADVPDVIGNTTRILGGMMIPVMLILLGAAIARLKVQDLKTASLMAVMRLVAGLIGGTGTVLLLGLTGTAAGALFLLSAMPSAVVCYVIAQRYNQEPEKVAGLVVASTVLTLLLLPALLWISLRLAG